MEKLKAGLGKSVGRKSWEESIMTIPFASFDMYSTNTELLL